MKTRIQYLAANRHLPYFATPILTVIWWLTMWFNNGHPRQVLRGTLIEFQITEPVISNLLFLIITPISIALYFWLLSTHRGRTERLIYAILWPAGSVAIYIFLLLTISGDWSGGVRSPHAEAALISGIYAPLLLFTGSWLSVAIGLAATLCFTEPYATRVRLRKLEERGIIDPTLSSSIS